MSASTIFATTAGRTVTGGLDVLAFSLLTFSIIFGWILVSMFQRAIEDLLFSTLGLNPRSTVHAFIIFFTFFFLFIATIWFIDSLNIVPASTAGTSVAEASAGFISSTPSSNASSAVTNTLGSGRNGMPIVIAPVNYF